jgi:hypothetical protein
MDDRATTARQRVAGGVLVAIVSAHLNAAVLKSTDAT